MLLQGNREPMKIGDTGPDAQATVGGGWRGAISMPGPARL